MIGITVKFEEGEVPDELQGRLLMGFEKTLRAITKLDIRVFKERMGDDSKLRVKMTKAEKERL